MTTSMITSGLSSTDRSTVMRSSWVEETRLSQSEQDVELVGVQHGADR